MRNKKKKYFLYLNEIFNIMRALFPRYISSRDTYPHFVALQLLAIFWRCDKASRHLSFFPAKPVREAFPSATRAYGPFLAASQTY